GVPQLRLKAASFGLFIAIPAWPRPGPIRRAARMLSQNPAFRTVDTRFAKRHSSARPPCQDLCYPTLGCDQLFLQCALGEETGIQHPRSEERRVGKEWRSQLPRLH